jgi:hypothetical protein
VFKLLGREDKRMEFGFAPPKVSVWEEEDQLIQQDFEYEDSSVG